MKIERAKQVASKAIEELTKALERGHSEGLSVVFGLLLLLLANHLGVLSHLFRFIRRRSRN
jgi:hypothetical protein